MRPEDLTFGEGTFDVPSGRPPVRVTWLGTAGFRVAHDGWVLLVDPYVTRASPASCVRAPLSTGSRSPASTSR